MKWLVLCLLILNLAVWLSPDWVGPGRMAEPSGGVLPRVSGLKPDTGSDLPAPRGARNCVSIGWFETEPAAVATGEGVGLAFRVEEQEIELPPLNWVLIPPQPEAVAKARFTELAARGVESYVVSAGEYRNAISLGLFESEDAAKSVFAEKKQDNLDVVLAKFPRNRIGYALVFDVEPSRQFETVQAVETESGKNFEYIESNACEGVATSEKNP